MRLIRFMVDEVDKVDKVDEVDIRCDAVGNNPFTFQFTDYQPYQPSSTLSTS